MNKSKIVSRMNPAQILILVFLFAIMLLCWDVPRPIEPPNASVAEYMDYFLILMLPIQTKIMFAFALAHFGYYWLSAYRTQE